MHEFISFVPLFAQVVLMFAFMWSHLYVLLLVIQYNTIQYNTIQYNTISLFKVGKNQTIIACVWVGGWVGVYICVCVCF
jgi:hypothetical protein